MDNGGKGKLIAFGCPDNTVRAIEAASGKQVLQMGSHSDWIMCTTFSVISGRLPSSEELTAGSVTVSVAME